MIHEKIKDFSTQRLESGDLPPSLVLELLQEECAELIQSVSKVKRSKTGAINNMVEEMTHVLICIEYLKQTLTITDDELLEELKKKAKIFNIVLEE